MRGRIIARSLWLGAGVYFMFTTITQFKEFSSKWMPILYGVVSIVMFVNAYITHKLISRHRKGE